MDILNEHGSTCLSSALKFLFICSNSSIELLQKDEKMFQKLPDFSLKKARKTRSICKEFNLKKLNNKTLFNILLNDVEEYIDSIKIK